MSNDKRNGIVYRSTGSWYTVKTETGEIVECRIKGKFRIKGIKSTNPIAVGDEVVIDEDGVITELKERKNHIIRKSTNLSRQTHIISANMDQAVLIATLAQPKTTTGFMDRFLITAEAYDIPAKIIFNKTDLYDEELKKEVDHLISAYEKIGYPCFLTSVKENINLNSFKKILKDKRTLLSGHSGVGKSSLVNAIEPGLDLKTAEISAFHEKGKHTTTFAEMFDLSFGGQIIDTPGIRSFGIVDFDKEELSHYFPEIFEAGHECRFQNCLHMNEPGCAVKEAVANKEIANFRYKNYLNIMNDEDLKIEY